MSKEKKKIEMRWKRTLRMDCQEGLVVQAIIKDDEMAIAAA